MELHLKLEEVAEAVEGVEGHPEGELLRVGVHDHLDEARGLALAAVTALAPSAPFDEDADLGHGSMALLAHAAFGAWKCRDELEVNAQQSFRYDEGRDRFCLLSDPRRCVQEATSDLLY